MQAAPQEIKIRASQPTIRGTTSAQKEFYGSWGFSAKGEYLLSVERKAPNKTNTKPRHYKTTKDADNEASKRLDGLEISNRQGSGHSISQSGWNENGNAS